MFGFFSRSDAAQKRERAPSDAPQTRRSSVASGPQLPPLDLPVLPLDQAQEQGSKYIAENTSSSLPPQFQKSNPANTGGLRIGDSLHLVDDSTGLVLGADGLLALDVGLARPQAPPTLTAFELVSATDGAPPDRLFVPPASSTPSTAERFGAGADSIAEGTGASNSGSRVDLELQRMAQWPRLLASYIERVGPSRLREPELERAMAGTLLSHPNILSMAVGFEPGVFFKSDDAAQPEKAYCRFVLREAAGEEDVGDEGGGAAAGGLGGGRSTDAPEKSGKVSFSELLPPFYSPLYTTWAWYRNPKISGRAEWSPPYVDEGTPRPMVTYSVPMWRHGVFVGVATMDVLLDASSTAGQATLTDVESEADRSLAGATTGGGGEGVGDPSGSGSEEADSAPPEGEEDQERTAALEHLERLARGPRREAARFAERMAALVLPEVVRGAGDGGDPGQAVASSAQEGTVPGPLPEADDLRDTVRRVVQTEPLAFGSCVAFAPGVFHGQRLASFYTCVDDSEGSGSQPQPSVPAGAAAAKRLIDVIPLDYDFTKDDWFKRPNRDRRDYWSQPYFDAGGGDIWMVTYSAPVLSAAGVLLAVVTIDIRYNQQVKNWFREAEQHGDAIESCGSCGLPCPESYWTHSGSQASENEPSSLASTEKDGVFCDRCVEAGLVESFRCKGDASSGKTGARSSLHHVGSPRWEEWFARTRRPKRPVRYGQIVQLRAAGSRLLLSTKIRRESEQQDGAAGQEAEESSHLGIAHSTPEQLLCVSNAAVERMVDGQRGASSSMPAATGVESRAQQVESEGAQTQEEMPADSARTTRLSASMSLSQAQHKQKPTKSGPRLKRGGSKRSMAQKAGASESPVERPAMNSSFSPHAASDGIETTEIIGSTYTGTPRSMSALAVALRSPSLQGYGAAAGGERLHGVQASRWRVRTETGPDPYLEGTSDTWFVLQCDGRADGEEVRWGDQIRLVSHRWKSPLAVGLEGATASELLGDREQLGSVADASSRLRREATTASTGADGRAEGVPFSPGVWYRVLSWVERARSRVQGSPSPLPRAVGISVLSALRTGRLSRGNSTGTSRRGTERPRLADSLDRGMSLASGDGAQAPMSTQWRVVKTTLHEDTNIAGRDGGEPASGLLAPSFIRLHAEGCSLIAEHDELHGASRRGRRAVRLSSGIASQAGDGDLANVWQMLPLAPLAPGDQGTLPPVALMHATSGRFAAASGAESPSGSAADSESSVMSLRTQSDVDDAARFTVHLAGQGIEQDGSLSASLFLSCEVSVGGSQTVAWVTMGSKGALLLELDREAALCVRAQRLRPTFGRPLRFWLGVRDALLGCSNVIRAVERQRITANVPEIHRPEQIRLLQGALAASLLVHDEVSSAEPSDAARASTLALQIATATRSEALENPEEPQMQSGGSTVWDAGTRSGGGSTRSEESDAALRAGEARRARDFTPEDSWWRVAILAKEERGPMNLGALAFFAASGTLPVLLDVALFVLKATGRAQQPAAETGALSADAESSPIYSESPRATAVLPVPTAEAAVELEVARRTVAVALHVCCAASQSSADLAAVVAPRVSELVQALASGRDPALSRLVAQLVAVVLTVHPRAVESVAKADVRDVVALVSSQHRLSHRLLQLLTAVCCQVHGARSGGAVHVEGDCGGSRCVPWAVELVVRDLLLAGRVPFVSRMLSSNHPFWIEMAEARGDGEPADAAGTGAVTGSSDEAAIRSPTHGERQEMHGVDATPACSSQAMQALLRLCHRLAIGSNGFHLRKVLGKASMLRPRALLGLVQDESLPPSAFGVRCQLTHLFRVLHVESQEDWRYSLPRKCLQSVQRAASGAGSGTGLSAMEIHNSCAIRPSTPADAWTGGSVAIARGMGEWRNIQGLSVNPNVVAVVCPPLPTGFPATTAPAPQTQDGPVSRQRAMSASAILAYNQLQDFFVAYLARCLPMATKNELSIAVLALYGSAIRRGLCSQRQALDLVPFLGQILSAEQDRDGVNTSRSQYRRSQLYLHQMKLRSCSLLHSLIDVHIALQIAPAGGAVGEAGNAREVGTAAVGEVVRAAFLSDVNAEHHDLQRKLLDIELRLAGIQKESVSAAAEACTLAQGALPECCKTWYMLASLQSRVTTLQLNARQGRGAQPSTKSLRGAASVLREMLSVLRDIRLLLARDGGKPIVDAFTAMGGIDTLLEVVLILPSRDIDESGGVAPGAIVASIGDQAQLDRHLPPLAAQIASSAAEVLCICLGSSKSPLHACKGQLGKLLARGGHNSPTLRLLVAILSRSRVANGEVPEEFIRGACRRFLSSQGEEQLELLQLLRSLLQPGGSINSRHQMIIVRELTGSTTANQAATSGRSRRGSLQALSGRVLSSEQPLLNPMQRLRGLSSSVQLRSGFQLSDANDASATQERAITLGVLQLLHDSAPNQLMYDAGKAVRRHEQAARLIQASVDWRGVIVLMVSVGSFDFKAELLRFVEQIFGSVVANGYLDGCDLIITSDGGLLASERRCCLARQELEESLRGSLGARATREASDARSDGAGSHHSSSGAASRKSVRSARSFRVRVAPHGTGGEVGAAEGDGAAIHHSIVKLPPRSFAIGLMLRDISASVELWCTEVLSASVGNAASVTAASTPVSGSLDSESFVFDAALPFTVGYFHSSFVQNATLDIRIRVREYFDVLLAAARLVLVGSRAGVGAIQPSVEVEKPTQSALALETTNLFSSGETGGTSVVARLLERTLEKSPGARQRLCSRLSSLSRDNVMMLANALLHVVDPQGKQRASGAFAGLARQENEMLRTIDQLRECASSFLGRSVANEGSCPLPSSIRRSASMAQLRQQAEAKETSLQLIARFVAGMDDSRLKQTVNLLLLDARAGLETDAHTRANSWLGSRPHAVVTLLEALAELSQSSEGQLRLVWAGAPRLVVESIAAAGRVVVSAEGAAHSAGDGSQSSVVESAQRLGRSMLEGGFRPAQEALLDAAKSNGELMAVIARELAGLPTALRTKQDAAGTALEGTEDPATQRWEGGLTLLQFLQQCCEGHNARFQDAFREQIGSATQYDIVTAVVRLLSRMCIQAGPWWTVLVYWDAWYEHRDLAVHASALLQTIETLSEMLQGPNRSNQRIACSSRLLETVTWILDAVRKAYFHCNVYTQSNPDDNDYGSWGILNVCSEGADTGDADAVAPVPKEAFELAGGKSRKDLLLLLQYRLLELVQALVEAAPPAMAARVAAGTMLQTHGPFLLGRLALAAGVRSIGGKAKQGSMYPDLQEASQSRGRSLAVDALRVSGDSFGELDHRICAEDVVLQWLGTIKLLCAQVGMQGDLVALCGGARSAAELAQSSKDRGSSSSSGSSLLIALEGIERRAGRSVFLEGHCEGMHAEDAQIVAEATGRLLELLSDRRAAATVREYGSAVRQVDVVIEGELQYLVFPLPPVVRRRKADQGWREARDSLLFDVDRSNLQAKVADFARRYDLLLEELCSFPVLRGSWLATSLAAWEFAAFAFVVLINLALLFSDSPLGENVNDACSAALLPLAVLHAAVAVARLASATSARGPLWLSDEARGSITGEGDRLPDWSDSTLKADSTAEDGTISGGAVVLRSLFTWGAARDIVYAVLSIAAAATGVWQLYVYHLLFDLVRLNSLLQQTLSAVQAYSGSLAAVGLFFFALIYMFALIGQALYREDYPEGTCENLLECVLFTVAQGGAGSGMSDILERTIDASSRSSQEIYESLGGGRAIFDVAFFLIIPLTMLSIISGIIIDAFGAQRDQFQSVQSDQESMCFVSGFESSHFDRAGRGFAYHIQHEQNMWDYVYLAGYLRLKDPTSQNGLETRVSELMHRQLTSYIPMGVARVGSRGQNVKANRSISE